MFVRDLGITIPQNGKSQGLVLIISPILTVGESLKQQVLELSYSTAGPFNSLNSSYSFFMKNKIDAIIFYHFENDDDISAIETALDNELQGIPLIFISTSGGDIQYDNVVKLSIVSNTKYLGKKLSEIIKPEFDDSKYNFLEFVNNAIKRVLENTPENFHDLVSDAIHFGLKKLVEKNQGILTLDKELFQLHLKNPKKFIVDQFQEDFKNLVNETIQMINRKTGEQWGDSLLSDSLEQIVLTSELSEYITRFVDKMGIDLNRLKRTIATVIPEFDDNDRNSIIFNISLSDIGPEMRLKISDNPVMKEIFNDSVASQILTLVGQGSMYHEGLFGPIPIPSKLDLTALIYSKMIKSSIKDERMNGYSLNVVGIGFKRKIMNCLPKRNLLTGIFEPFLDIINQEEIDANLLGEIQKNFYDRISD